MYAGLTGRAFVGGPDRALLGLIGPGLWTGPGYKHLPPSLARPKAGRAIPKPITGRAGLFSNGPGGPPSAHGPAGQMMRPIQTAVEFSQVRYAFEFFLWQGAKV